MKSSYYLLKKVINAALILFILLLGCINTFASISEGGATNDDATGIWEIVWSESVDGENVSSKKMELNDLIVIKVVAKARQTETYYRTVGWAVYTRNTLAPTNLEQDQYVIGSRDMHRKETWGIAGSPLMNGSEFITTSSEEVRSGYNYADFRINKNDIFSAFMKKGTKFNKDMLESDGKIKSMPLALEDFI